MTLPEANEKNWARLIERLDALEARVHALEHHEAPVADDMSAASAALTQADAIPATDKQQSGYFPVLGKALLGIAGAYLLRAVAESGAVPRLVVALIALLFASGWLLYARRVAADRFASTTYAATSALIFAPMLWELVLKFNLLSPETAALVLALYAALATALTWGKAAATVDSLACSISDLTAIALAIGLAFATQHPAAFFLVLALLAAKSECFNLLNRPNPLRWLHALALDFTLWAMLFIYVSTTQHTDYAPLDSWLLIVFSFIPLILYIIGAVISSAIRGASIQILAIAQLAVAFALTSLALIQLGGDSGHATLGWLCLTLAAASYALALTRFNKLDSSFNKQVFAGWSLLLVFAGALLLMQPPAASLLLAIAALLTVLAGLRLHGILYLLAAVFLSGLSAFIADQMFGSTPAAAGWSVWVAVLVTIAFDSILITHPREDWFDKAIQIIAALLAVVTFASAILFALVQLTPLHTLGAAHHIDLIRTVIVCTMALLLAYASAHWKRRELMLIDYALLVVAGGRVLVSDALHGHLEYSAAAIALVAVTFILLPRVMKMGQKGAH
jgi:hypothetical protein